jgi:CheY-like chemotaxis protein
MRTKRPILLVEDDGVDAITVSRALKEIHVTNKLVHTANGEEAIEYLNNMENTLPAIILLDLRMPKMNGIEFLKLRENDPRISLIPVVVLTTSNEEKDRLDSFSLGVAGYMEKPVDYIQFVEVIRTINLYWTLSELPELND